MVSVGNANVDIFFVVDNFPKEDQEVIAIEHYQRYGGAGANVAVALAKLGLRTCFLGCVGNDELGLGFIKDLKRYCVDTTWIYKSNELNTGRVVILIKKDTGQKMMIAYRGANALLKAEIFPEKVFKEARHLHISSLPPNKAIDFIRRVKRYEKTVSYDPGSGITAGLNSFIPLLRQIDILFLNKSELFTLTGVNDLRRALNILLCYGVKGIVVKLGKNGALYKDNKIEVKCPAFKVKKVVDTTGAGDAFDAGFLYGFLNKLTIKDSLTLGNAVAALKIRKKGARSSPTKNELLNFLKENNLLSLYKLIF